MSPEAAAQIDQALADWRQGDVVLSDGFPILHLADLRMPGTAAAADLANGEDEPDGLAVVATDAPGFMVVSQTCDIVRSCAARPFVEICPLIEVPVDAFALIRRGRRPQYVALPGVGEQLLAADLDRTVTLEKAGLVGFSTRRHRGVTSEAEARDLADALGRKRSRSALPDDFVAFVRPLQQRIIERHGRQSEEGRFLRAVREVRVRAIPDWAAEAPEIELLFVFDGTMAIPNGSAAEVQALVQRLSPAGRFESFSGRAVGLDQLSAASYLDSDRLDLEHLSPAAGQP